MTKPLDAKGWCEDCHILHNLFIRLESKDGHDFAVDLTNDLADVLGHPPQVGHTLDQPGDTR